MRSSRLLPGRLALLTLRVVACGHPHDVAACAPLLAVAGSAYIPPMAMAHRQSFGIQVRVAEGARDHAAIRRLFIELLDHGRASDKRLACGADIADAYLESLISRCGQCEGRFLVAELSGQVIGYMCVLARAPCQEPAEGLLEHAEIVDLVVPGWRDRLV